MIPNIANYVNGVVKIRITGAMPEKFVNLCMANHVLLWGITKRDEDLYANMKLSDFFRIRHITRLSQVKVRVIAYSGLPFFVKKVKRRKMLLVGAILSLIMLNLLASYIWFIDVTGAKQIPAERIKQVALQHGLKPGVSKDNINSKQLEKEILLSVPEIAWVGVNFYGTRAEIEVVEKTVQKSDDKAPADLIAAKDGVISEFIVLAGKPLVKKGDTVKKGDVLITGIVPEQTVYNEAGQSMINNNPPQLVRANGIIKARVWYETYGEAELNKPMHERTGRKEVAVNIHVGDNVISLKSAKLPADTEFESEVIQKKLPAWRNSSFTVESQINIYHEVNTVWLEKSAEEARDEARSKALAIAQNLIPESAQILSRNSEVIETAEPNIVRVKVSVESIEEIGRSVAISSQ